MSKDELIAMILAACDQLEDVGVWQVRFVRLLFRGLAVDGSSQVRDMAVNSSEQPRDNTFSISVEGRVSFLVRTKGVYPMTDYALCRDTTAQVQYMNGLVRDLFTSSGISEDPRPPRPVQPSGEVAPWWRWGQSAVWMGQERPDDYRPALPVRNGDPPRWPVPSLPLSQRVGQFETPEEYEARMRRIDEIDD